MNYEEMNIKIADRKKTILSLQKKMDAMSDREKETLAQVIKTGGIETIGTIGSPKVGNSGLKP